MPFLCYECFVFVCAVCAWRCRNPELGYEEVATSQFVYDQLRSYGITEIRRGVATTGIVAVVRGSAPGKCIAFRADMDALPIIEDTGCTLRGFVGVGVVVFSRPCHW